MKKKHRYRPDTVYRLASMTKPVTAVSALLQNEAGKLNLDDKLSKYCSKFSRLKIGELDEKGKYYSPSCSGERANTS